MGADLDHVQGTRGAPTGAEHDTDTLNATSSPPPSSFGRDGVKNKRLIGDIGCLLTVHNGHNGWLGKDALGQYLTHVVDRVLSVSRQEGMGSYGSTSSSSASMGGDAY